MIIKALCLTTSGIAHAYAAMPPSASKGAQKADKITDEYWLKKLGMAYTAPAMFATLHILQTVAYILLMTTASETNTLPAVLQLADSRVGTLWLHFSALLGSLCASGLMWRWTNSLR